jgi:hypothetical protein
MGQPGPWEAVVTGVELILTALNAGAAAAGSTAANSAVTDAYATLKSMLSRLLARRESDSGVLEAGSGVTPVRLREALVECGADADREVVLTAQQLLHLVDANLTGTIGRVRVDANLGAVGTFNAPVTITNHAPSEPRPDPPAQPGRA